MVFDSREYMRSLEPPRFVAPDGTEYVGRVLSLPQWQRYEARVTAAKNRQLDWAEVNKLILDLCDAFFPPTGSLWSYVTGRRRTVRWHVSRMTPVMQMAALWDFMKSQGKASGVLLPETPGTTQPPTVSADASPASRTPTP